MQDPPDTQEDPRQDPPDTGVCISYAGSSGHTGGSQAGSSGHRIHAHTQEDPRQDPPEHPLNWHAFISLGSTGSSGLLVLILGLSDTCRQQWTCMIKGSSTRITYVFIEGALSTPSTSDRVKVAFIVEVVL